ncbi:MAG: cyclic nucleotide-binding domain-containing protein [Gammaproteobacteria bacterium]|nr:cyclic nucleotide-binding domain-containing protein [Gammaproteobacteria bacterium]
MLRPSVELLRRIPILNGLNNDELQRVIDMPGNVVMPYAPHEVVFAENELAECMYILLEGAVDVRIGSPNGREITIATLKTGEFFGEQALLPGATGRRNATVRALTTCKIYRVSAHTIADGIAKSDNITAAGHPEQANDTDRIRILLRSVRLFRSLSPRDMERVGEWTKILQFTEGDIILREQEIGDSMYVVLEGTVEVFVMDDDGKLMVLGRLTRGHYFGEQALLPSSSGRRNASVRAIAPTTLVQVAKRYMQAILGRDDKLSLALNAVGEAQRQKTIDAIGREGRW